MLVVMCIGGGLFCVVVIGSVRVSVVKRCNWWGGVGCWVCMV